MKSTASTSDFETYPPTVASCKALIRRVRAGGLLSSSFVARLFVGARDALEAEPRVAAIGAKRAVVVGDLHGSFDDLCAALAAVGPPKPESPLIFNGDYVDRNHQSTETLALVLALKLCYGPDSVHVNRGNHEDIALSRVYDFERELEHKYAEAAQTLLSLASSCFAAMPLAATLFGGETVVVHGHVNVTKPLEVLNSAPLLESVVSATEDDTIVKLVQDVLWSDPDPDMAVSASSNARRGGAGALVSDDDLVRWLGQNGVRRLVRSHEVVSEGARRVDLGRGKERWTVFSCAQYPRGEGLNKAAVLELTPETAKPRVWGAVPGLDATKHKREVEIKARVKALLQRHRQGLRRIRTLEISPPAACAATIGSTQAAWADHLLPAAYPDAYFRCLDDLDDRLQREPKITVTSSALASASMAHRSASIATRPSAAATFRALDLDGDGRISYDEFEHAVKNLDTALPICPQAAWLLLDADDSGFLEPSEFSRAFLASGRH